MDGGGGGGEPLHQHQQWAQEYVNLPPAGFKPKSAVDTACQSARCSVYFLVLLLVVAVQVCLGLAVYQVVVLGTFVPVRCHITSEVMVAEMVEERPRCSAEGEELFYVDAVIEAQGRNYTLEHEPIGTDRLYKLLSENDTPEHTVPVNLTIQIGQLVVNDERRRAHESTTCFLRGGDPDTLYLETTATYDVASTAIYVLAATELVFVFLAVLWCCCGETRQWWWCNPCVLLRMLCFCGQNDTSRRRIQPDSDWSKV